MIIITIIVKEGKSNIGQKQLSKKNELKRIIGEFPGIKYMELFFVLKKRVEKLSKTEFRTYLNQLLRDNFMRVDRGHFYPDTPIVAKVKKLFDEKYNSGRKKPTTVEVKETINKALFDNITPKARGKVKNLLIETRNHLNWKGDRP